MPITTGFTSRGMAIKGKGHIHSDKWHRCVEHVKEKGGGYEPHAVCTFSIGYKESVNPEHRTPGPHSSADTRRFKRRKERKEKEAEKQDISFAAVLKFDAKKKKKAKHAITSDEHTGSCDPKTGEPTERSTFS